MKSIILILTLRFTISPYVRWTCMHYDLHSKSFLYNIIFIMHNLLFRTSNIFYPYTRKILNVNDEFRADTGISAIFHWRFWIHVWVRICFSDWWNRLCFCDTHLRLPHPSTCHFGFFWDTYCEMEDTLLLKCAFHLLCNPMDVGSLSE